MNVKAALSPDDLARACAEAMWKEDDASGALGMRIVAIGAGSKAVASAAAYSATLAAAACSGAAIGAPRASMYQTYQ